jgi:hypothetical protein
VILGECTGQIVPYASCSGYYDIHLFSLRKGKNIISL